MARNETTARVLKVIHILEIHPQGLSIRDLYQKLQDDGFPCSVRTVYRDLEAIQAAYFPVTREGSGDESKWKLESIATLNEKVQFSYHELMALFLAKNTLENLQGSGLYPHIKSFFTRLEKALGPGASQEIERLREYMAIKPQATWQSGVSQEILDTIYDACAEGHVLEIDYTSKSGEQKDKVAKRRLGPEGIYFADSGVYLIALDLNTQTHKTYAIARILQARMTTDAYESKNFSLAEYIKDSMGVLRQGEISDVELFIQEPMASYVSERRWHQSQKIIRVDNGIRLKLHLRINDELVRWVLGLGSCAEVVSPKALHMQVQDEAAKIMQKIDKNVA